MPSARAAPVELVAAGDNRFTDEERAFCHVRLRAVTFLMLAGFALVLVRDMVFGRGPGWPLQAALIVAMGLLATLLSAVRSFSVRGLMILEGAAFGLAAMVVAIHLWNAQVSAAVRGDPTALASGTKDAIIGATIVMFTYALLVPAPHGRAWRAIVLIAAFPLAAEVLVLVVHPEVFRLARRVETGQRVGESLFLLTTSALLSGYGAYLVQTMRVQAREARQFNQYLLGELVGEGGMGAVYRAEHRLLKRPCALKVIRPERAGDPRSLERFEQEVRATARLSDPHIVDVYDYGRAVDGTFFYVMEYMHGLSLEDLVRHHGPLPPGRVIYLLRQVCEALAEAHAAGLVHRDLTPANIFAARRGRLYDFVKVLDFGLVETVTTPHEPPAGKGRGGPGTPLYMAPEQVSGDRAIDARADLYTLGGVAYIALTGRPPFAGETAAELKRAHVHDAAVPPSRHRPDIAPDLEAVVLRCLAKDPDARFQSAEELEAGLTSCTSASDWDARRAAAWWETLEPSRARTGGGMRSGPE